MPGITRREALVSGLALSASTLAASSSWGLAVGSLGVARLPDKEAVAPRERLLFDSHWKFRFGHADDPARDLGFANGLGQFGDFGTTGDFDFAKANFDDSDWRNLDLPHDWAVELPFVDDRRLKLRGYKPLGRIYPETSVGWYRRRFFIPASDLGRRISLDFDGVSRTALVFINGCFLGRADHAYAPFRFDLTDFLRYGQDNYIAVRVDASLTDGWFYQGAGIYRHTWLEKTDALHLEQWESTVRTTMHSDSTTHGDSAALQLGTVVRNEGDRPESASVRWRIVDPSGATVASFASAAQTVAADGETAFAGHATIPRPALWSVDTPHLYTALVSVYSGGGLGISSA